MMKHLLMCTTILTGATTAALAQDSTEAANAAEGQSHVNVLSEWVYDDLYSSGWTVETMFDRTSVLGENGDEIGDVENVLIGADGEILSLIVEVGGFWDIGDTHVSVPWEEVTLGQDMSQITVPVTEENADDFSIFGDRGYFFAAEAEETETVDDDLYTGERVFKATELIGDYAYLTGEEEYGYVSDLVFNKDDGKLLAVLVDGSASGAAGPYAYPYIGYDQDWHPDLTDLTLPYSAEEVTVVETFDYDELDSMPAENGSEQQASGSMENEEMSEDSSEQASSTEEDMSDNSDS